jgi:hypothetical protein
MDRRMRAHQRYHPSHCSSSDQGLASWATLRLMLSFTTLDDRDDMVLDFRSLHPINDQRPEDRAPDCEGKLLRQGRSTSLVLRCLLCQDVLDKGYDRLSSLFWR